MSDPTPKNGHRMQHSDEPTWCVDCGEFYAYGTCTAPGSGRFDNRTDTGFLEILDCLGQPQETQA